MIRPMVSTGPPAAKGTTMVTARVGQFCALAVPGGASDTPSNAAAKMVLRISLSPGRLNPR